jgi:lysozyme
MLEQYADADTVCGVGTTVQGIDVSDYQGTIDWTQVSSAGVVFAFIRVSDGLSYPDSSFSTYWKDSRAAGVIHGAYQFFEPSQDPIAQADMLLSAMGPMQADDLPPVIDVEVTDNLDSASLSAAVQQWVDHVQQAIGRAPIIYTGKYFWDDNVGANMSSSPLWHAQYTSASCPDISQSWTGWKFWQYADQGNVNGISGTGLDMDWWNGDRASLQAFLGPGGPCGTISGSGGMIDISDACFTAGGPSTGLRTVTGAGMGGSLIWTHTTDAAAEQNYGQWNLNFATAGTYHVEVYTDTAYAQSKDADYQVQANGQLTSITIDQAAINGWQSLGDLVFAAGGNQFIHLGDNTGEAGSAMAQLAFDGVQITPADTSGSAMMGGGGGGGGGGVPDPSGDTKGGCSTTGGGSILGLLGVVFVLRRRKA